MPRPAGGSDSAWTGHYITRVTRDRIRVHCVNTLVRVTALVQPSARTCTSRPRICTRIALVERCRSGANPPCDGHPLSAAVPILDSHENRLAL